MCSFGSCQTRFEFLSQFRKVWNECFVTQVQTHLPKTKRVWPMKIKFNVICTVLMNCSWTIFLCQVLEQFMNCDGELFMNFGSWTNNASILWTFHELFMNVHEQFIKSWTTFHDRNGRQRSIPSGPFCQIEWREYNLLFLEGLPCGKRVCPMANLNLGSTMSTWWCNNTAINHTYTLVGPV